jgi:hypothetical protein
VDNERTDFPEQLSAKRYYTEHVRISTDEGADNEPVRADINEKLRRGWRLVSMTPGPSMDSVELVWNISEGWARVQRDLVRADTASHEAVVEVAEKVRANDAVGSGGSVGDGFVRAVGVSGGGFASPVCAVAPHCVK